jgi:hypothetical protein
MKPMDKAFEIARELAKVLIHNKELLEKEDELAVVIGARYGIPMERTFQEGVEEGKASVIVNDLSPLNPEIPPNKTWN